MVSDKRRKIVVFLGSSANEKEIQRYAYVNGLEILYTFKKKGGLIAGTSMTIRKGFKEFINFLRGKRSLGKKLFARIMKKMRESVMLVNGKYVFNNDISVMAMVEYLTQYQQSQGLLVYDVKDIYPHNLSVVRYVIEKIRGANKEVYSVVPYNYESLPECNKGLKMDFERKWDNLIATTDFCYRKCPPIVSICIFEKRCFCKCRFCYQVKNPGAIKEEYMDFDLFKKIINDIPSDERLDIIPSPGGEPLTYPRIHEFVRYIADTRPLATTEYSTNGIMMDRENSIKIIKSGLKRIMISLNAPSREDYEWFTGIDAYDRVLKNTIGLMELRSKLGSPTPIVKVKIVGMKRWSDKIEKFIQYWNNIVDIAMVLPVSYYQDEDLENIELMKPSTNPLVPTCFYLANNIIIMPNGRFQICCAPDFTGEKYGPMDLGNAKDRNLIDVWCGEKYTELRKINAQGLTVFANCLTCNINRPDFELDLIVKSKQRKLLGLNK